MKRVLVINGHPDKESFCNSLTERYKRGADLSGAECAITNLTGLEFTEIIIINAIILDILRFYCILSISCTN